MSLLFFPFSPNEPTYLLSKICFNLREFLPLVELCFFLHDEHNHFRDLWTRRIVTIGYFTVNVQVLRRTVAVKIFPPYHYPSSHADWDQMVIRSGITILTGSGITDIGIMPDLHPVSDQIRVLIQPRSGSWILNRSVTEICNRCGTVICYRSGSRILNRSVIEICNRCGTVICYRCGTVICYRSGSRILNRSAIEICNRCGTVICYRSGSRI